jgi:hypothetical protein
MKRWMWTLAALLLLTSNLTAAPATAISLRRLPIL